MKRYLLSVLLLVNLQNIVNADTLPSRRMELDSINYTFKHQMESFDSTIKKMDAMLDAITGKKESPLDTLALYYYLQQQKKQKQRQKNLFWVKSGALAVIVILALAGWGRIRRKKAAKPFY